jgi:hypothetical protein
VTRISDEIVRMVDLAPGGKPTEVRLNLGQAVAFAHELAAGEWQPPLRVPAPHLVLAIQRGMVRVRDIPIRVGA